MKFKTKYSVYAPDFVGILVAITYIAWSIRGQKHDKTFTLTLWLSFILFYDFAVSIAGKWFHGGLFIYNLCIVQSLFHLCKGYLFNQLIISCLQRVVYILKLKEKSESLKRFAKILTIVFMIFASLFFGYEEWESFTQNKSVLLIKPNTYTYTNLGLEKTTNFINGLFYSLSLVVSIEIFLKLRKQNFLYLASSAILLFINLFAGYMAQSFFYTWFSIFECIALYLVMWGQSSLTKREDLIMMIYD